MIGVERTRGTGVCLEVDEEFDDLVFADAIVESDPQLAAEWLMGAKRGGDCHRDQATGTGVELLRPRPAVAEGMNGGEAAERASAIRLSGSKRQLEWPAEQFAGQLERGVVGVGHSDPPSGLRRDGPQRGRVVGLEVTELRVAITVADFDRALAFYRDALGLSQIADWSTDRGRVVVLEAGPGTIELLDERQAELVDEIEAGRRMAGKVRLALQVGDSDATAEQLIAAGAAPVASAVTTPWGDRNTRVRAPDGMQLTLFTTPS